MIRRLVHVTIGAAALVACVRSTGPARAAERGRTWWRDNTLGIQHMYPAGALGLDSDPKLIEISRNMIEAMGRWVDNNGTNSFIPAAVRVGYDPKVILARLGEYVTKHTQPNGFAAHNPHGIEIRPAAQAPGPAAR